MAAVPYLTEGNLDLALAAWLSLGAVPGVLLGAALAR
ncbi:MAG: sulfite exporter TauE/SafE family protein, partial [Candidatus Latescibacteria bacterium]|nr:sulfite exporter TauE/SafE family protein [Candidatus Latescibacterota bacterium]